VPVPEPKVFYKGDNIIPENKIAFCYFCKKYLHEEEQIHTHAQGKKHKNLALDTKKWYRFHSREEYEKGKNKKK
jgi:hypothetical protein